MNVETLKAGGGIIATVVTVISWIVAWVERNKDKIQAIVLRVEKDAQDGWTQEEKEDLAVKLFKEEVYPLLPWYVKILPSTILENQVRKIIRTLCKQSHKLKHSPSIIAKLDTEI
jgi:hypothetical protein